MKSPKDSLYSGNFSKEQIAQPELQKLAYGHKFLSKIHMMEQAVAPQEMINKAFSVFS